MGCQNVATMIHSRMGKRIYQLSGKCQKNEKVRECQESVRKDLTVIAAFTFGAM